MGAGAEDGVVGDGEGRGLWAAAGRPENPGLRLPEVIRGQQTVHLRFAAAICSSMRRGLGVRVGVGVESMAPRRSSRHGPVLVQLAFCCN